MSAERVKRYRKRIQEDDEDYEDYKERERKRQKRIRDEKRELLKNNKELAEAQRKYDRERKAEQRKRSKEKENSGNSSIDCSRQKLKGLTMRKKFQKDQRNKIEVLQVILVGSGWWHDCRSILDCHKLKDFVIYLLIYSFQML